MGVADLVFLLDVDNTLIDNDQVKLELQHEIARLLGPEHGDVFWELYEQVRHERDYVDFPATLERYAERYPEERRFPHVAQLVLCCPYERWLYPDTLATIAYLRTLGTVAILSDGDPVFQPAKIARAGLADAVDDNILIYAHKEQHLDEVRRRYPGIRHVFVDDKPGILARVKSQLGEQAVTLFVDQGKYAHGADRDARPAPDLAVETIAEVRRFRREDFLAAG
jgi:FMN phosphatase YigB (HAD superfamily)